MVFLLWKNVRDANAVVVAGRQRGRSALRVAAMVAIGVGVRRINMPMTRKICCSRPRSLTCICCLKDRGVRCFQEVV